MSKISPEALSERFQRGEDVHVLDIREESDYEDGHVPGSENVAVYDDIGEGREDVAREKLTSVPRDDEVVTVCSLGVRSQTASELLREEGYDAATLVDGMAGWNRVHLSAPVDVPIDGRLVQVARPGTGCLSHVLVSDGEAAVFDPSSYLDEYEAILEEQNVDLVAVFDSHAHADHVSGGRNLATEHGVPYYRHPADVVDETDVAPLSDGDDVAVGETTVVVIHTPGHSPGSVSFGLEGEVLLTGDTLFHESVGRVELGVEAGMEDADVADNADRLYDSLRRLREYGTDPVVLPAHDPGMPDPPVIARMSEVQERNDGLGRDREPFVDALIGDVPEHPPNFERIKRINVGTDSLDGDSVGDLERGPNNCAAE